MLRSVRLKLDCRGPNGNYAPGEVVQVDPLRAQLLVDSGHAEYVDLIDSGEPAQIVTRTRRVRGGNR